MIDELDVGSDGINWLQQREMTLITTAAIASSDVEKDDGGSWWLVVIGKCESGMDAVLG